MGIYTPSYSGDTTIPRFDNTSTTPINEVYFGQTPGITRCFEAFSAWRSKYVMDSRLYMINTKADSDPLKYNFIKEMEREFGLYSFSLFPMNEDNVNAFTIPMVFKTNKKLKGKDRIEFNKDGYKFKKECQASIITFVYTGLLWNSDYTDREVFATILHEIGHNFQSCISDSMTTLSSVSAVFDIINLCINALFYPLDALMTVALTSEEIISSFNKCYNEFSKDNPGTLINVANTVRGVFVDTKDLVLGITSITIPIAGRIANLVRLLGSVLLGIVFSPVSAIKNYYGEAFADKFAAYYGFGPDIVSCLSKFGDNRTQSGMVKYLYGCPIYGHFMQCLLFPFELVLGTLDCHPRTAVRYHNVRKVFENDLKDPRINPKLKKQIEKELDDTEKKIDEVIKKGSKIDNPSFLNAWVQAFIYKIMGGRDVKKILFDAVGFDVDKSVNDTFIKNTKLK